MDHRFRTTSILPVPILISLYLAPAPCADLAAALEEARLRAHVETLASDGFEGRRGPGSLKARDYVAGIFKEAGLAPAGEKGYLQEIREAKEKGEGVLGFNVLGLLPGTDPKLKKEHIILSAHHDHLGKKPGGIYHGADDDATGVAALLEAASVLKAEPRKRSVLFISFDLEEEGLVGSLYFADHPTVPLADVALFINMDMLGRDLGGFVEGFLFALGTEHSPALKDIVREAGRGSTVKVGMVGTDVIGIRGDYGPFLARRIPYLFFSTGEHPDYHRVTDTADRILYPKLLAGARIALRTLVAAADLAERPAFTDPKPDLDEVKVVAVVVEQILGKSKELDLKKEELAALSIMRFSVKEILERGQVTPEEREQIKGLVLQIMGAFRR